MPVAVGFVVGELGALLGIAVAIIWVCGIVDLMTKRPDLDGRHRSAWILVIVLLPIIGTLAYFFVRPTLPAEKEEQMAAQQATEGTPGRYGEVPRRT